MRVLFVIAVVALVAAACSSDDSADTTTTTQAPTTTTTQAPTTTTTTMAETTTTTVAETTTTTTEAPTGAVIATTPVVGELQPYSSGGAELFPPGSVQAHWYQWDGLYVVLYRGFDASDGSQICAGNSAQEAAGFNYITNSPHNGTIEEICDGSPKIAEEPSGVYACGPLLYYLTEIPIDVVANLWGTLEIVKDNATVVDGQTSAVPVDIENTPEFEPGLTAYELPSSTVDDLGAVTCG